jgi:hypothetical protein
MWPLHPGLDSVFTNSVTGRKWSWEHSSCHSCCSSTTLQQMLFCRVDYSHSWNYRSYIMQIVKSKYRDSVFGWRFQFVAVSRLLFYVWSNWGVCTSSYPWCSKKKSGLRLWVVYPFSENATHGDINVRQRFNMIRARTLPPYSDHNHRMSIFSEPTIFRASLSSYIWSTRKPHITPRQLPRTPYVGFRSTASWSITPTDSLDWCISHSCVNHFFLSLYKSILRFYFPMFTTCHFIFRTLLFLLVSHIVGYLATYTFQGLRECKGNLKLGAGCRN